MYYSFLLYFFKNVTCVLVFYSNFYFLKEFPLGWFDLHIKILYIFSFISLFFSSSKKSANI
jgi:hypothetical protein